MTEERLEINYIKMLVQNEEIFWRNHILIRMQQRSIRIADVINCILTGAIIEEYPTDNPYPSCLICGRTLDKKFLHVVCAIGNNKLWMITTYYPNPDEWDENFTVRRG